MEKPLRSFSFVLYEQIVSFAVLEQWRGNGILFADMLLQKQRSERFVYAFELGVEGTVVKMYLFDDRGALDVVVIRVELKIKNFDSAPPLSI